MINVVKLADFIRAREAKLLSSDQYLRDRNEETEILRKQCIELNRKVQAAAREAMERATQIALAHGKTIGDDCWNHENNRNYCKSTCWQDIAAAIRAEAAKIGGQDGE